MNIKVIGAMTITVAALSGLAQLQTNPHWKCVGQEDPGACDDTCECPDGGNGGRCCVVWTAATSGCTTCVRFDSSGVGNCTPPGTPPSTVTGTYSLCDCIPAHSEPDGFHCECSDEGCQGPFTIARPCHGCAVL
jgi:hypothetical protein